MTTDHRHRAHWIGAPEFFELNQACQLITMAFPESFGVYLVGSALRTRDHRDVDVRCIMPDDVFDAMFPMAAGECEGLWFHDPRWSFMCATTALWLRERAGLKIDFQFQRATQANESYSRKDGHGRNALGLFLARKHEDNHAED